jgi:hypothetical protein
MVRSDVSDAMVKRPRPRLTPSVWPLADRAIASGCSTCRAPNRFGLTIERPSQTK